MKSSKANLVSNLAESFFVAIFLVLVSAVATAKAQDNLPNISQHSLNGLFYPTAADRFFEAGREDFEQEIDLIVNSEQYFNQDILQIDPQIIEQMQDIQFFPDAETDHSHLQVNELVFTGY